MNELSEIIRDEIRSNGPMRFKRFMGLALYHPELGFYSRSVSIGKGDCDFSTHPESGSPYYGKAFANFISFLAKDLVGEVEILEQGAGNGTLALDVLTHLQIQHPALYERLTYRIMEISPYLRQAQREKLAAHQVMIVEGDAIRTDPGEINGFVLTNELPDAFPIDIVVNLHGKLCLVEVNYRQDCGFFPVCERAPEEEEMGYLNEGSYRTSYPQEIGVLKMETICQFGVPINLDAKVWYQRLSQRIKQGAVITTDYGEKDGMSLMAAVRSHNALAFRTYQRGQNGSREWSDTKDPLNNIGQKDMTSDINFQVLRKVGEANGMEKSFLFRERDVYGAFGGNGYFESGFFTLLQVKRLVPRFQYPINPRNILD